MIDVVERTNRELRDSITRIESLHSPHVMQTLIGNDQRTICAECNHIFPCGTINAISGS